MDPNAKSQPKAPEEHARAEVKTIALLAGVVIVLGAFAQLFVEPGPVSASLFTVGMTVALVAAGMLKGGKLKATLGSFRLAAVVLAILSVAAALGTLILQDKPDEFYARLGSLGGLIIGLRLDDIFHSLWFGGVVALMNAGLIVSAAMRWPITARNVGFFAVHLGILVSLAGAGVSSVFAVKGRIDLRVGQTESTVRVTKAGLETAPMVPLGGSVQLLKFDVDRYADQPRVSFYLPNSKGTDMQLKASFENELGIKHRLPGDAWFRIKASYPDLVVNERLVEGGAVPALKLTAEGQETFLMPGMRPRLDLAGGDVVVLFGRERPAATVDAALHTIKGAKGEPVAVRLGETAKLPDGTELKVLRFFPHFTYDIQKKEAANVDDVPSNPALQVQIGDKQRWLFANMPGFGHGEGGPELTYAFAKTGGKAGGTVIAVGSLDRSVLVRKADGTEETFALAEGLEVQGVRFGALLEKATLVREPTTASQEMKNPAITIEIGEGGKTREVLLSAEKHTPAQIGKGVLVYETRIEDVKAFRSEVLLKDGDGERKSIIAVNDPVRVGDWTLYQVNYDPKDPTYSGLEAMADPGVTWVFVGFGLLFFGVSYMTYVAPRLRRKEA